jgi:hypothetical protein
LRSVECELASVDGDVIQGVVDGCAEAGTRRAAADSRHVRCPTGPG